MTWKSTGTDNLSANSDLKAISDGTLLLPTLENYGRMSVKFNGNYFVQNKVLHLNNNNVVNIYIVYKLDTINNTRNTDYTIQNALFGEVKIVIFQKIIMKDMEYALMKEVHLLREILLMIKM